MTFRNCLPAIAAAVFLSSPAHAQEVRATVGGVVTDPSGAAVPDARITITNVERNTIGAVQSNATGRYFVQFLLPGSYTVSAAANGFKQYSQRGIKLEAADRVNLDIRLEVGAQNESVNVTSEASILETETATRATEEQKARKRQDDPDLISAGAVLTALRNKLEGERKTLAILEATSVEADQYEFIKTGFLATAGAMLEDNQGALWIGAEEGLFRFDGTCFRQIDIGLGSAKRHVIRSLAESEDGSIWATSLGGLSESR